MSNQYTAPGFEPTIFQTSVVTHNHKTRATTLIKGTVTLQLNGVVQCHKGNTRKSLIFLLDMTSFSVTRLGNLLDFGQVFKAFGNN